MRAAPIRMAPPPETRLERWRAPLEEANPLLAYCVRRWLAVHGKPVPPRLSAGQEANLLACFQLMDEDGSGAIDADELSSAFKLLGFSLSRAEVNRLVEAVDKDGSGEIDLPEFIAVMTTSLDALLKGRGRSCGGSSGRDGEPSDQRGGALGVALPFDVVATAYKRKKLMIALQQGNKEFVVNAAKQSLADGARLAQGRRATAVKPAVPGRLRAPARRSSLPAAAVPAGPQPAQDEARAGPVDADVAWQRFIQAAGLDGRPLQPGIRLPLPSSERSSSSLLRSRRSSLSR